MPEAPEPEPICAVCKKPIEATENKTTIQYVSYHARCWDRQQARRTRAK